MASFIRPKRRHPVEVSFECEGLELLPGEIIVARIPRAEQVIFLTEKTGFAVLGILVSTNYRVSFIPDNDSLDKIREINPDYMCCSKDIPLGCISQVSVVSNRSKKVLDGVAAIPKKISQFEIICKDMRKLVLGVKHCEKNDITSMANAIARHSHPANVNLLFAFDYTRALMKMRVREVSPSSGSGDLAIPTFLTARDWQRELLRLGVTNDQWRVTEINKKFLVCNSLCPYFACPTNYSDSDLENAAGLYNKNRLPLWCWSHPHTGVSLTRGASTSIDDSSEAPDPVFLRSVVMARHKQYLADNKRVYQYDLTKRCGTVKSLSAGFSRLHELCLPGSPVELFAQDRRWLGGLDSSEWLSTIRCCLLAAKEISNLMCIKQRCVLIMEETGRDFSCVVSSLVQMMIDPYFRSISGFEILVQKEWVAMGHPFTTRNHLTMAAPGGFTDDQAENIVAPVFLLFLDCVWQLSKQFPSAFEFSEFFLLRFHDMTIQCLYNNFLFDSAKQRLQSSIYSRRSCFFGDGDEPMEPLDSNYEGPLLSAWGHWRSSLNKEENEECLNPLYYIFGSSDALYDYSSSSTLTPEAHQLDSLLRKDSITLVTAGNQGLYKSSRESSPVDLTLDPKLRDYYQRGLLMPETSICSMAVWSGFFFRFIPNINSQQKVTRSTILKLESRMVRDVRKIKDELNEMELAVGCYTSDLTSFIGEVLQTREKEMQQDREFAVDLTSSTQPRLSAVIYSYNETDNVVEIDSGALEQSLSQDHLSENGDAPQSSLIRVSTPLSPQKTSLAQFTDALYTSEMEEGKLPRPKHLYERAVSSPTESPLPRGRSPVIKTRLRVMKSKVSDPVIAAWQHSPQQQPRQPKEKFLLQKDLEPVNLSLSSSEITDL